MNKQYLMLNLESDTFKGMKADFDELLQQLLEAKQWEGPHVHQLTQHNCLLVHEGHLEEQGEEFSGQQGQGLASSWLALEHLPCAEEHKRVHGAGPGRQPPAGEGP